MKSIKTKAVSVATAVLLMLGSAAVLPQNAFSDSVGITASAKEGAVIETKDMQYVELADGTLKVIEYIGEGGAVTIPQTVGGQTVTSIGDYAFRNGKNYFKVTSVQMPDTITSIGERAFYMCSKIEKINIPKSLKSIGAHAFGYTSVSEIKLPDGLTSIGESAFEYCTDLTEMTIPGSVKSVGSGAFFYCKNLEKVTIKEGTMRLMSGAFFGCYKLSQVSLPSTLITIGANAFLDNYALKSIDIPKSVTQIGSGAFNRCKALTGITLPESLTSLGSSAFSGCEALKSITIPSGVKEIEDETFGGCTSLASVTFKGSVTSIGAYAFQKCSKLASITLPDSVASMGSAVFAYCTSLKSIKLPSKLTAISWRAFDGCTALESVTMHDGITEIRGYAFDSCVKLQSIKLPSKLTEIGEHAFFRTTGLKSIFVPDSVKSIGKEAFGYYYDTAAEAIKIRADFKLLCNRGSSVESWVKTSGLNFTALARIAGNNRYQTAAKISFNSYSMSQYAVLACGTDFADALAGVPLAKALNAPILLTAKDSISADALSELKRLGAKKVVILGGEGVISKSVETVLKNNGITGIERVAGKTRYDTAVSAAKRMQTATGGAPSEVFFVNGGGFADALSVGSAAAIKNAPIIYLNANGTIDANTKSYLASIKGKVKNAYVIGGTGVVSDDLLKTAGSLVGVTPKRIAGQNRYATCIEVAKTFASCFTSAGVCVAKGQDFPDALAGGVFAARQNAPILLADNAMNSAYPAYLKTKNVEVVFALGGTSVVPDSVSTSIALASN